MGAEITLHITDDPDSFLTPENSNFNYVVLWNSFTVPESADQNFVISLPRYVEINSERLKERFLSFVDQVGQTELGAKSLIDHLALSEGFSYWWMTLFACKRWTESSKIVEAIKLLALEEILVSKSIKNISISISDRKVERIVEKWCFFNLVEFRAKSKVRRRQDERNIRFHMLPRPTKAALVLLREIFSRRNVRPADYNSAGPADTILIDNFSRFDVASAERGEFISGFWGLLLDTNQTSDHRLAFVHNFVTSVTTPNKGMANQLLNKFNAQPNQGFHILLDTRIQAKTAIAVIRLYSRLVGARFRARSICHWFTPNNSRMDLWPLFKHEWLDSLSGSTAMRHSIIISDFKIVAQKIPLCRQIVYLMENQPWEMAFLQIFKEQRPEPLIGYPHSTIRYWDLRYWKALNKLPDGKFSLSPSPNKVVSNGPSTRTALESSGFKFQEIEDVEALPYLYLGNGAKIVNASVTPRLLIFGDFFAAQNSVLLNLLRQVDIIIRDKFITTFKPHPLCRLDQQWIGKLNLVVDNRPLSELLLNCDVVVSTNGTSAAAEAYQFGVKVITVLNGDTPNFSPLRDLPGAVFIASALELQQELECGSALPTRTHNDYFSVDNSLTGWQKVLSIN